MEHLRNSRYCGGLVSQRITSIQTDPADAIIPHAPGKIPFRGSHYQHLGKFQDDPNYGCPIPGSKTEFRGKLAWIHVSEEIVQLCKFIQELGWHRADGRYVILFGKLFQFYQRFSEKVVGVLIRARKQGLIDFEGEMLYQRQDEMVPITLVQDYGYLEEKIERERAELKLHPAGRYSVF